MRLVQTPCLFVYLLFNGWIATFAKDEITAKAAFAAARPIQEGYVRKWPDQARPLMILGTTDAVLGNKEEAIKEGRQAMQLALTAKSDINGLTLGYELAEIYLWVGEPDLALSELESLKDVPLCLFYGDLRKDPTWDTLQGNPRFERLLMGLGPITPVNTPVRSK